MQLVIDIKEATYDAVCKSNMLPPDITDLMEATKNGTLLPKGHGELKDVSVLIYDLTRTRTYSLQQGIDIENFKRMLINAPTVVEADSAKSEGKE